MIINTVFIFRIIHAIFALVTLFFVLKFLTPIEQGWYYTFLSLSSLIYFFDYGLSSALIHISAIESVNLKWGKFGEIFGNNKNKFLNLLKQSLKYYIYLAITFFIVVYFLGIIYFNFSSENSSSYINWSIPWLILILVSSLSLLTMPFLAILEGAGKINEIYKLRIIQILMGSILAWILIYLNFPLYAASMILLSTFIVTFVWTMFFKGKIIFDTARINLPKKNYIWKDEIWPFQWKVGTTWLSSFIFLQIYTPLLFYFNSPVEAGQMGLSLAILNMLALLSHSWITNKIPSLTKAATEKNWILFDSLFIKAYIASNIFLICSSILLVIFYNYINYFNIQNRILSFNDFIILIIIVFLNHQINCMVANLRSHKREPLVWILFSGSLITVVLGFFAIKYYSISLLVLIILLVQFFYMIPISYYKWKETNNLERGKSS